MRVGAIMVGIMSIAPEAKYNPRQKVYQSSKIRLFIYYWTDRVSINSRASRGEGTVQ